jgi:hypothetical protein
MEVHPARGTLKVANIKVIEADMTAEIASWRRCGCSITGLHCN